jgi:hypothetical protein
MPTIGERVGKEIRAYLAQSTGRQEIEFRILRPRRQQSAGW